MHDWTGPDCALPAAAELPPPPRLPPAVAAPAGAAEARPRLALPRAPRMSAALGRGENHSRPAAADARAPPAGADAAADAAAGAAADAGVAAELARHREQVRAGGGRRGGRGSDAGSGERTIALVQPPPPLPPSRTNWTRLVPPPVLTGHVSSLLA